VLVQRGATRYTQDLAAPLSQVLAADGATHFGMYLFEKYYGSMTYPQFREELWLVLHLFAGRPPRTRPVRPEFARNWPYPAEEFNQP
jgi:hypothetical protein